MRFRNEEFLGIPQQLLGITDEEAGATKEIFLDGNHLIEIDVVNAQTSTIFPKFTSLRTLSLCRNSLFEIPSTIHLLSSLTDLRLSGNRIHDISSLDLLNIATSAVKLQTLYLHDNLIELLPEEIGLFEKLKILMLDGNRLGRLPATMQKLENLTALSISTNKLTDLPSSLPPNLLYLWLTNNTLQEIPIELFSHLGMLKKLYLSNNRIARIPTTVAFLQSLAILTLSNNQLQYLPYEITELLQLRELKLDRNLLSTLPSTMHQMESLELLSLNTNFFTSSSLFPALQYMKNLKIINARHNLIESLDDFMCSSVERLDVASNDITKLSNKLTVNLPNLKKLDLTENHGLVYLPATLVQCSPFLEEICVSHTILVPPASVCHSPKKTVEFLRNADWTNWQKSWLDGDFDPNIFFTNPTLSSTFQPGYYGYQPLHFALILETDEFAARLMKSLPAEIDAKTNDGRTALALACLTGKRDSVAYLLDHARDISVLFQLPGSCIFKLDSSLILQGRTEVKKQIFRLFNNVNLPVLISVFGESCAGKSTLIDTIKGLFQVLTKKEEKESGKSQSLKKTCIGMDESEVIELNKNQINLSFQDKGISLNLDQPNLDKIALKIREFAGGSDMFIHHKMFVSGVKSVVILVVDCTVELSLMRRTLLRYIQFFRRYFSSLPLLSLLIVGTKYDIVQHSVDRIEGIKQVCGDCGSLWLKYNIGTFEGIFLVAARKSIWSKESSYMMESLMKLVIKSASETSSTPSFSICEAQLQSLRKATTNNSTPLFLTRPLLADILGIPPSCASLPHVVDYLHKHSLLLQFPRTRLITLKPLVLSKIVTFLIKPTEYTTGIVAMNEIIFSRFETILAESAPPSRYHLSTLFNMLESSLLMNPIQKKLSPLFGSCGYFLYALLPNAESVVLPSYKLCNLEQMSYAGILITGSSKDEVPPELFPQLISITSSIHHYSSIPYQNAVLLNLFVGSCLGLLLLVDNQRAISFTAIGKEPVSSCAFIVSMIDKIFKGCPSLSVEFQPLCPKCIHEGIYNQATLIPSSSSPKCDRGHTYGKEEEKLLGISSLCKYTFSYPYSSISNSNSGRLLPWRVLGFEDPFWHQESNWSPLSRTEMDRLRLKKEESSNLLVYDMKESGREKDEYERIKTAFETFVRAQYDRSKTWKISRIVSLKNQHALTEFTKKYHQLRSKMSLYESHYKTSTLNLDEISKGYNDLETEELTWNDGDLLKQLDEAVTWACRQKWCFHKEEARTEGPITILIHLVTSKSSVNDSILEERKVKVGTEGPILQLYKHAEIIIQDSKLDEGTWPTGNITIFHASGVLVPHHAIDTTPLHDGSIVLVTHRLHYRAFARGHFSARLAPVLPAHDVNLMLSFSGGSEQDLYRWAATGVLPEIPAKFTVSGAKIADKDCLEVSSLPSSISAFRLSCPVQDAVNQNSTASTLVMMVSWAMMGRMCPAHINEHSQVKKVQGYDSCGVLFSSDIDSPSPLFSIPSADSIFLFNQSQVLPSYLVYFNKVKASRQELHETIIGPGKLAKMDEHPSTWTTPLMCPNVLIWIDPNRNTSSNRFLKIQIYEYGQGTIQIVHADTLEQAIYWLEVYEDKLAELGTSIRFMTNRERLGDGNEKAGEKVVEFVKSSKYQKCPVLLFDVNESAIAHIHQPKNKVYVTCDFRIARAFALFKEMPWDKIQPWKQNREFGETFTEKWAKS